jgi:hypothetical protein
VIVVRSAELLVRIDPRHGGEILDFIDLRTGRQLLGRPPFGSTEPLAGDLDEETWTAAYRGGWQFLIPNAGNPCTVAGKHHGFHGRGSNDPWHVVTTDETSATLGWSGHGLEAERRLSVEEAALAVVTEIRAPKEPAPFVTVEHVSLGLEVLDPEVSIDIPGGRAFELSESDGPPEPPAEATAWPEALLLDGATERAGRWPLERERSRLLCVTDLREGRVTIRNGARGVGVALSWDLEFLPYMWIWHELRRYGGPWRGHAEVLVVEPASVPHTLGLATAIEHEQARWLQPDESCSYRIVARALGETE